MLLLGECVISLILSHHNKGLKLWTSVTAPFRLRLLFLRKQRIVHPWGPRADQPSKQRPHLVLWQCCWGLSAVQSSKSRLLQPLPLKRLLGPLLGLSALTPSLDPQTCPFPLKIATGESVLIIWCPSGVLTASDSTSPPRGPLQPAHFKFFISAGRDPTDIVRCSHYVSTTSQPCTQVSEAARK